MKVGNLDRAVELYRELQVLDGAAKAVVSGSFNAVMYFEGRHFSIEAIIGTDNLRTALKPHVAYARSQVVAEMQALGVEVD